MVEMRKLLRNFVSTKHKKVHTHYIHYIQKQIYFFLKHDYHSPVYHKDM